MDAPQRRRSLWCALRIPAAFRRFGQSSSPMRLSPLGRKLATRLQPRRRGKPCTLLGRIVQAAETEVRSQVRTLSRWLIANGQTVAGGQSIVC